MSKITIKMAIPILVHQKLRDIAKTKDWPVTLVIRTLLASVVDDDEALAAYLSIKQVSVHDTAVLTQVETKSRIKEMSDTSISNFAVTGLGRISPKTKQAIQDLAVEYSDYNFELIDDKTVVILKDKYREVVRISSTGKSVVAALEEHKAHKSVAPTELTYFCADGSDWSDDIGVNPTYSYNPKTKILTNLVQGYYWESIFNLDLARQIATQDTN